MSPVNRVPIWLGYIHLIGPTAICAKINRPQKRSECTQTAFGRVTLTGIRIFVRHWKTRRNAPHEYVHNLLRVDNVNRNKLSTIIGVQIMTRRSVMCFFLMETLQV